jgi:hypothetical protein
VLYYIRDLEDMCTYLAHLKILKNWKFYYKHVVTNFKVLHQSQYLFFGNKVR